ncbi:MAG: cell division protein ZapA [Saprospiraceae bacterium]|nr:cell division protein ZapA [Saprospiraceae bacterium]
MEQNDLRTIQITVAGRVFPLKVSAVEEEIVHEIEQELNDAINNYQHQYASRDKLDCVLMTLLKFAFEDKKKSKANAEKTDQIIDKIENIDSLLKNLA